jgi:small-conductance mechanosensitive channel
MALFSRVLYCALLLPALLQGQPPQVAGEDSAAEIPVPQSVEVSGVVNDMAIRNRLNEILEATGWFIEPQIKVEHGVVFLDGLADSEVHRGWAERLAASTQDVVAVVNRMDIIDRSLWDLTPASSELRDLAAQAVRQSPLISVGLLLLGATWMAARWSVRGSRRLLRSRIQSALLADIAARAVAIPVLLMGLYLVLKVSGLTRLALTVLGGTGLIGLVIGFAFRDIAENFLASILIGMQRPFATNDLIEVAGFRGYVQNVNTRSTLLMTLDGNHVQIPNATIYKETITNFTSNPKARYEFTIGIGYSASISDAQSIALDVLRTHPAVVEDPEPLVLVDALGPATVNLRVYFWINIARYSPLKVRSAVIRLTKGAFQQAGISMPDEAREVIFPEGVPIRNASGETSPEKLDSRRKHDAMVGPAVHSAEGDLSAESEVIEEQARTARLPEGHSNLLKS